MAISPTPIQEKPGTWTSGTSFSITQTSTPTTGNWLIYQQCQTTTTNSTAFVSSLSQTGVTWLGPFPTPPGRNFNDCEIWYGSVGASPSATLTINLVGTPVGAPNANLSEWSGITSTDSSNTATGTNSIVPTATLTPPAGRNALFIACTRKSGAFNSGPTNGWTPLTTNSTSAQFAYKVVASTSGGESTSWTFGTSSVYDSSIAAFLAPAGLTGKLFTMPDLDGLGGMGQTRFNRIQ